MSTNYKIPLICMLLLTLLQGCTTVARLQDSTSRQPAGSQRSEAASDTAASQLRRAAMEQLELGNSDMASSQLERSLSIEPDSVQGYFQLARVRVAQGFYTEAKHLARKALSLIDIQELGHSDILTGVNKLLQRITVLEQR